MKKCYVFISDNNCKDYLQISLRSFMLTNPKYEVLVYTKDMVDLDIDGIKQCKISDIPHIENKIPQLTVPNLDLLSYRLKILEDIKNEYDKIMMLDADMIFLENIDELFDISEDRIVGVNELDSHVFYRNAFKLPLWYETKCYLNSGMLVIPTTLLRKYNIFEDYKNELNIRSEYYICPEQDYINYRFKDNLLSIPRIYNCVVGTTNDLTGNAKVVHYCGRGKPLRNANPLIMLAAKSFYDVFEFFIDKFKDHLSTDFYKANKEVLESRNVFLNNL